jgi:hypothetical protein
MVTDNIHGMPCNDHKISRLLKSLVGVQDCGRDLRPRCLLCGKVRSTGHRRGGMSAFICSRPACDQLLKTIIPSNEPSGKQIILEVHHYLHDNASLCKGEAASDAAELSGQTAEKWVEMPDNKSRRVTRAMTRQLNASHYESPPLVRAFTKPTLQF